MDKCLAEIAGRVRLIVSIDEESDFDKTQACNQKTRKIKSSKGEDFKKELFQEGKYEIFTFKMLAFLIYRLGSSMANTFINGTYKIH